MFAVTVENAYPIRSLYQLQLGFRLGLLVGQRDIVLLVFHRRRRRILVCKRALPADGNFERGCTVSTCQNILASKKQRLLSYKTVLFIGALSLASVPSNATAESLRQALFSAYKWNPQLDAQRAALRATDESVPQARSNYRPSLSFSANTSLQQQNTSPDSATEGRSYPSSYTFALN